MSRGADNAVPKGRKEGHESNLRAQLEEVIRQRDHLASQLAIAEREAAELRESVFELSLRLSESGSESGPTVFSLTHGFFYSPQQDDALSHLTQEEPLPRVEEEDEQSSQHSRVPAVEQGDTSPTSSVGSTTSLNPTNGGVDLKPLLIGEPAMASLNSLPMNNTTTQQQQPDLSPIFSPNKVRTSVLEELTTSKLVLDGDDNDFGKTFMQRSHSSSNSINSSQSQPAALAPLTVPSSSSFMAQSSGTPGLSPGKPKNTGGGGSGVVGGGGGGGVEGETTPSDAAVSGKKTNNRTTSLSGSMTSNESSQRGSRPALGMTAELRGHQGAVYAVRFSHDGEWLCSGGFDSKVISTCCNTSSIYKLMILFRWSLDFFFFICIIVLCTVSLPLHVHIYFVYIHAFMHIGLFMGREGTGRELSEVHRSHSSCVLCVYRSR
jgi:hypothetical protein